MIVAAIILACAAWLAAGVFVGVSWCARKNHCIRQQRRAVKQWTRDITGEITPDMQARLARRAAMDAALKDTSEHPAQPDASGVVAGKSSTTDTTKVIKPRPGVGYTKDGR
jgi:hypothetical protein